MPATRPARPRSAEASKQLITEAARAEFARVGYERATVRAIARGADVDPALVMRYFESKAGLFVRVSHFELDLPDLTGLSAEQMADALVEKFFEVWEGDGAFLALLRGSASSETAAATMRSIFAEQVLPALTRGSIDRPAVRAALVGSQVIGFAWARYVLRTPFVADLSREQVRASLGPALVHHLTVPLTD